MTVKGITYTLDKMSAAQRRVLVSVDTAKLDRAWRKDGDGYLPSDGSNDIAGRRAGVQSFLASGKTINAPSVYLAPDGRIAFRDGRHRMAYLRDNEYGRVVVAVDRSQSSRIRRDFN